MPYITGDGSRVRVLLNGGPASFVEQGAGTNAPWPTPVAFSEGEYMKTADTSPPTKAGATWTFTIPTSSTPSSQRRIECQWLNNGLTPHYTDGQIIRAEFTVVGNLGAAATTTTQDHWHVLCQLYGPSDDPALPWGRFVKHGLKVTRGKLSWYGGDAHPLHQWTEAGTREYDVPLADYADGTPYRIVVEACAADHPDGWLSVWCNGVLWSKGEKWRPRGMWGGVETDNFTGVKYTHAPGSWVAIRNGLYRGTNSAEADRPTSYAQSVQVTPIYLTPDASFIPKL